MAQAQPGPPPTRAAPSSSHYFHRLPTDVLGLIVPYVLYDWTQNCAQRVAMFAAPMFGALVHSAGWRTITASHPYFIYRSQWSSSDALGSKFLTHTGQIDYARLLNYFAPVLSSCPLLDITTLQGDTSLWRTAVLFHFDRVLVRLRATIAEQLRTVAARAGDNERPLINCLDAVFSLDVFAVPHQALEDVVALLCARLHPAAVCEILRRRAGAVNHPFFTFLYERYVEPVVGKRLTRKPFYHLTGGANEKSDDIIRWRRLWFDAALTVPTVTVFVGTCRRLGYSMQRVRELLRTREGHDLGLTMPTFHRRDAVDLVRYLNLWAYISPDQVTQVIIPYAPRLRAALVEGNYTLSSMDLRCHILLGLPQHITPLLGPDVTLLSVVNLPHDSAVAAVLLALLAHSGGCVATGEIAILLATTMIRQHNLANYIVPVERIHEPDVRAQVIALGREWGWGSTPLSSAQPTSPAATPESFYHSGELSYYHLYLLFLLYFVEHGGQPRTPFQYYGVTQPHWEVETRTMFRRTKHHCKLTLIPRPYGRIVRVRKDGTVSINAAAVFHVGQTTFVWVQAHSKCTVRMTNKDVLEGIYDYDIRNWTWLQATVAHTCLYERAKRSEFATTT